MYRSKETMPSRTVDRTSYDIVDDQIQCVMRIQYAYDVRIHRDAFCIYDPTRYTALMCLTSGQRGLPLVAEAQTASNS